MSEWWTYTLSDIQSFSLQTWYRLFERYNAAIWPAQIAALALGSLGRARTFSGSPAAGCSAFERGFGHRNGGVREDRIARRRFPAARQLRAAGRGRNAVRRDQRADGCPLTSSERIGDYFAGEKSGELKRCSARMTAHAQSARPPKVFAALARDT